ncbi:MAG TPA: nuclear transport factor 2 family protein [Pyrinomonadaceae bacterium]|jgi:hypothetical protein
MSRLLFLRLILLSIPSMVKAQEAGVDKESAAIRKVVETYLFSEEPEERKRTLYPQARVLSVDLSGTKVVDTAISKPAKKPSGKVIIDSRQKILSIDMAEGGATVKIETDLSSDLMQVPKHIHYLSLLKISGEWKIVSILMPPVKTAGAAK